MNKKGQVLVTMIILLPIILLLFMVIMENANIYYQKHRAVSITKTIISKALLKNEKDDIISIYKDNNIEVDDLKTSFESDVNISFSFHIDSLTGFKKNGYDIKVSLIGYLENNKVKFKKG